MTEGTEASARGERTETACPPSQARESCREFQRVVSGIVPLLAEAGAALGSGGPAEGTLEALRDTLEEGNKAVATFEGRSWLGRYLRGGRDGEELVRLASKLVDLTGQLGAYAVVQGASQGAQVSSGRRHGRNDDMREAGSLPAQRACKARHHVACIMTALPDFMCAD